MFCTKTNPTRPLLSHPAPHTSPHTSHLSLSLPLLSLRASGEVAFAVEAPAAAFPFFNNCSELV